MGLMRNILATLAVLACVPAARADWSAPLALQVDGGFDHIQLRMAPSSQFNFIAFGTAMGFEQDSQGNPDKDKWDLNGLSWTQRFINPAQNFVVAEGNSLGDNWLAYPIYVAGNPDFDFPSFHLQAFQGETLVKNLDIYYTGLGTHPSLEGSWLSLSGTWGNTTRLYPYFFPGDANYDAAVDMIDVIEHWQANYTGFGGTGMTWSEGDWNGDGSVDMQDIIEGWQEYYTGPITGPPPLGTRSNLLMDFDLISGGERVGMDSTIVPEPAGLGLLFGTMILLALRRTRGRG
jgi:hypothetical protein